MAWSSSQWVGRIGHIEKLPAKVSDTDLRKVAAYILPNADALTITTLAGYATVSKKHLASIEAIAKRAAWLAGKNGRDLASTDDIKQAMKESYTTCDATLTKSHTEAPKASPRVRRGGFAARPRPLGGIPVESFSRSGAPVPELVAT